jgi:hypothetical protein
MRDSSAFHSSERQDRAIETNFWKIALRAGAKLKKENRTHYIRMRSLETFAREKSCGLTLRLFVSNVESQVFFVAIDPDLTAFLQSAEKNFVRQPVFDIGLNDPTQGPGSELGIIPLAGQPAAGVIRYGELDFPGCKLGVEFHHEFIDNLFHNFDSE